MKIMKSQIDASLIVSELKGYRPEANFTVRLTRVSLAGETAWSVGMSSETRATADAAAVRYFSTLAEALNALTSVIRNDDEQKQLVRAL